MTWNDWLNSDLCKSGNWFKDFYIYNGWEGFSIMANMFNGFSTNYICDDSVQTLGVQPGHLISNNHNYIIYSYSPY